MRTEEEQIDAIKSWWKENGKSTVLGIVVALAIVLGWRGWQDHQRNTSEMASAEYQNLLSTAAVQPGEQLSDEKRKTAEHLAAQIKQNYEGLAYGRYAALWLAKSAVEQGDLAKAQTELEWVKTISEDKSLAQVAQLRLARVLLAQDKADQALAELQGAPVEGFQASFYEVQGDVYLALGRDSDARTAYQKAKAAPKGDQRPILAIKLDDLAEGK
ncbi:MAG: tetratricopeptide repeat protein [Motiliproteus sp.]|nr:tetratricopeptide repeat protein [Motiliproteus sp.]MCW9053493.1 tetratricopeptide repeat protein [Motiliproteus sp.]